MARLFALVLLGVSASASAAPDEPPYPGWAQNMERAMARGPEAFSAAVLEVPAFTRIWAHGHLADVVDPRVPPAERTVWRGRLRQAAETLKDPALRALLADPRLPRHVEQAMALPEQLQANLRAGSVEPVMLASAVHARAADVAWHAVLFRAGLTIGRPTDPARLDAMLDLARLMAVGRAVTLGRLDWFADLAAFHGTPGVPVRGPTAADDELVRVLNARLAQDQRAVLRHGELAVRNALRLRGRGLFSALVDNLGAYAAGWSGRADEERAIRVQVLQAIRPMGQPKVTAALVSELIRPHLALDRLDGMLAFVAELVALGKPALDDPRHRQTLLAADGALAQRSQQRLDAKDLAGASRLADARLDVAQVLARPDLSGSAPEATVLERRRARNRALHDAHLHSAEIALRRGLVQTVAQRLGSAEQSFAAEGGARQAAARALRVEALLRLGQLDAAAALARAIVADAPSPGGRARAALILGEVRLRQGRLAPAFAHANDGLRRVRQAGLLDEEAGTRARLHRLAGVALHAAGHLKAARGRLSQARALTPRSLDIARLQALAALDAEDHPAALRALDGLGADAPIARVWRGCVHARAGQDAQAQAALADLGALAQPHLRRHLREGSSCLTALHLSKGRAVEAAASLKQLRATSVGPDDPWLVWRLRVLEGQVAALQDQLPEAAGYWRQARDGWIALGGERASRGFLLDARTFALPATPDVANRALVSALIETARRDPRRAQPHLKAALSAAVWRQRQQASPALSAMQERAAGARPDAAWWAGLTGLRGLNVALADPILHGADRARVEAELAQVHARASSLRQAFAQRAPARAAYLAPTAPAPDTLLPPPGEARLYYALDDDAGHLWLGLPGQPLRHYALPNRAAVATVLAPAMNALAKPRGAADWPALQAPVDVLLPFLADAKVREAAAGLTWWVVPDGPLATFPIEALVMKASEDGPPTFVGAQFEIRRALLAPPIGPSNARSNVAVIGPPDAESAAHLKGATGGRFAANREAFGQGLAAAGTAVITAPLDVTGGFITGSGGASGRLGDADVAFGLPGARRVIFTRAQNSSGPDASAGLRRVVAALHHHGARDVLVLVGRRSGDQAAGVHLAGAMSGAVEADVAVSRWRRAEMAAVDAERHHPAVWARWLHYAPLPLTTLRR